VGQYDKDSKISFKYIKTERYEKHLTYFCDYQMGQSLTVDMTKARTVEPYLVGRSMREEVEHDFHMPLILGS
jgi:hypothetical protein